MPAARRHRDRRRSRPFRVLGRDASCSSPAPWALPRGGGRRSRQSRSGGDALVVDFAQTSNPWMRGRPRRWGALTMSTRLALGIVETTVRVTIDRPSRRRTCASSSVDIDRVDLRGGQERTASVYEVIGERCADRPEAARRVPEAGSAVPADQRCARWRTRSSTPTRRRNSSAGQAVTIDAPQLPRVWLIERAGDGRSEVDGEPAR